MANRKQGTRVASGPPPDFVVAYQQQQDGSWHVCMQWGKLCSPTAERAIGADRVNSMTFAVSPREALCYALKMFPSLGPESNYVWPWRGKPAEAMAA